MGITLNDNLKINAGKPIDSRYLSSGNTVYASVSAVNAAIIIPLRYTGLTVNVLGTEYWYASGVTDGSLIQKKYNSIVPSGNFITGATNIGYFNGFSGIETLPITNLSDANYNGNYYSLYNYYYRGTDGIIHVGTPSDGIERRGYVKTSGNVKSWIWNEYTATGGNLLGWILVSGNISNLVGTFQTGYVYYPPATPYTETGWTTGIGYNNGSNVIISNVVGSLTTGNTLSIGGPPYIKKVNEALQFRTVQTLTPNTFGVTSNEAFIYLSGATQTTQGTNVGTGAHVFKSLTGLTLQFRSIQGSGNTTVNQSGDDIIIFANSGSGTITGATSGLHVGPNGRTIALGGTLTGSTFITDPYGKGIQYSSDYSGTFNNNSLITKLYANTVATGLRPKAAVELATTAPITLSGNTTIDGIMTTIGMRVLVKDQITGATNGVYSASTGNWGRTSDFDGSPFGEVVSGTYMWVLTGITNGNTAWVLITPDPIFIGVTPLNFALFAAVTDVIGGTGITINNNNGTRIVSIDIPTQNIINTAITNGANGLTRAGHDIALGGILTGSTCICTCGYNLDFGCSPNIGLNIDSSSISAFHCTNSSNGDSIILYNTGITMSNKTSGQLKTVCLGANSLVYAANYSSYNTNNLRWIPDKEYVDSKIICCSNMANIRYANGTNFYANVNDEIIAVSGQSSCPIFLTSSPQIICNMGQRITVVDICGNALMDTIIIDGNGKLINGGICSIINTDYGSITFTYNGCFWSAISFVN